MTDNSNATNSTPQGANNSTLIEFPGLNRNRPAWRKELSERFREIQQRRAREAASEDKAAPRAGAEQISPAISDAVPVAKPKVTPKQLGLVPQPDEPELNPIVVAALRRIERARKTTAPSVTHSSATRSHGAATAAARVVEEQPEYLDETIPTPAHRPAHARQPESLSGAAPSKRPALRTDESGAEGDQARASSLVVVPPKQPATPEPKHEPATHAQAEAQTHRAARIAAQTKAATSVTAGGSAVVETPARPAAKPSTATQEETGKPQPRHIAGVIDEFWLERQGIELLPKVAAPEVAYDDRAPRAKRLAAAFVDLVAVAFLCAPFAALIELTIGNWGDAHVAASMGGIVAVVMFLYQACSVALAGRTWGMWLCSLQAVDAATARVPTTGQCVRRAILYMLSLAAFGLGVLYSLFDAEGRTAHDILSGTVVVKK
ncbi:MAG: hypothetical protein DMF67_01250 [Acidobacteria bacterium]|nr:MAG: hypothetical protein DMF67_01250 [Acidobacteriota bacterium]